MMYVVLPHSRCYTCLAPCLQQLAILIVMPHRTARLPSLQKCLLHQWLTLDPFLNCWAPNESDKRTAKPEPAQPACRYSWSGAHADASDLSFLLQIAQVRRISEDGCARSEFLPFPVSSQMTEQGHMWTMCQDERAYRAKPLKDCLCPKGCELQVWEFSMITANSNLQAKRSLSNTARMYIA